MQGILKKNDHKTKKHVTFNEEEIKEYDKQRGNKMKIDEPKTPYEFNDEKWKFEIQQKNQEKLNNLKFDINEEFEQQQKEEQKDKKHKKFLEMRKNHYKNEFKPI